MGRKGVCMWFLFWGSIIGVLYAYFGYPLSLAFIGILRNRRVNKKPIEPVVTLIITAYNEERRLESKLSNTLQLDYPREKLEIIVASDGSTDRTNAIAARYEQSGV
jgi:cellulose synthase/poly-beta-1,6-N-acetylglucosamine synthase-like glycosyltransferase